MEDLAKSRQMDLAWGSIDNLVLKIVDIENGIQGGWPELIEMVGNTLEDTSEDSNLFELFSVLFTFMYHLLFRLKANPTKRAFNQVSVENIAGKEVYRITNYDYNAFKWAKSKKLIASVNDDCLDLPKDKLTESQQRAFDRRKETK